MSALPAFDIGTAVAHIESLCRIPSPTGYTAAISAHMMEWFRSGGYAPGLSVKGSVSVSLGGEGRPLVLAAHLDTLGAMVRSINASGTLQLTKLGSYPGNYIEQCNCTVHTRDGRSCSATVRLKNPAVHVNPKLAETERSDANLEIVLDEKVDSAEAVRELGIDHGDIVSLDPDFRVSSSGYIKSRHLDDKASAGLLMALAEAVRGHALTRRVYLLFTTYEEVGHGGAAGVPEDAEEMISVDMGAVGDDLATNELKLSICAKDSSGPYDYALTSDLIARAKRHELDYAVDIYPNYSSDVSVTIRSGRSLRHGLIGPGVSASHGYERCHTDGLENVLKLLLSLCLE